MENWFIIATVRDGQGTTQELYGPFEDEDAADRASRILQINRNVVRQIVTQPLSGDFSKG